jgi:uncharacterized protein (TIGR00369 family)
MDEGVRVGPDARRREYTWSDPVDLARAATTMSGLDFLRAIADGRFPHPPIMTTAGIELAEAEEGRIVFALTPAEWHYNPIGSVHGGVLSTLADSAAACAVHSKLPVGTAYTSIDLTMKFLRPVTSASGRITAEGTVLSMGRRTALCQAELRDAGGRLVAYATSTCLLMPID